MKRTAINRILIPDRNGGAKVLLLLTGFTLFLGFFFQVLSGSAAVITVGKGSYTDVLPAGETGPPVNIYKTTNLKGPVPTSDWWTSLISQKYSSSHFAHPLCFEAGKNGLSIGLPVYQEYSDRFTATACEDLKVVGVIDGVTLEAGNVSVDGFSDWTVSPYWQDQTTNEYFKATYGHGLVYVYFEFSTNCQPQISFPADFTAFSETENIFGVHNSDHIGITTGNKYYGLFAPAGSIFEILDTYITVTLPPDKRYFAVGVMTTAGDLAYYYQHAYAFVTDTKIDWTYDQNTAEVSTVFTVTTEARQDNQMTTLLALFPHQWKNSSSICLPNTFRAVRGIMKLIEGNTFTVVNKFQGILPFLPDQGSYDKTHLQGLLNSDKNTSLGGTDTYFHAKKLAKVANLLPIAAQLQDQATQDDLVNRLKNDLINWFTYSSGEKYGYFYYDNNWRGLIGYDVSFGAENYTDHHFHYGYFVYASALLALYDPGFITDYGEMVELLINEYACPERDNTEFPFLRMMDPYEGHSWCDGMSAAGGNNQESSSEAMNAWAAIILWGMVTDNDTIRDLGIWGYTTEYSACKEYYFDIDNQQYSDTYQHNVVGILFSEGGIFNTWFSSQVECIHGIQAIPITASMLYLGYEPDYVKENYEALINENGGPEDYWYDIIWRYQTFYDPAAVIAKYDEKKPVDDGTTKTFNYHWLYNLAVLGNIDTTVYADTPYYTVFNNKGVKTYVAFNSEAATKEISFYNGGYLGSIYVRPDSIAAASVFASEVTKVEADTNKNTGESIVTIEGSGFKDGSSVYLQRTGEVTVTASKVDVLAVTKIIAELDLTGLRVGKWELLVVNPGERMDTAKPNVFYVLGNIPAVLQVTPPKAKNKGQVEVVINGVNFYPGLEVKLTRTGEFDIIASSGTLNSSSEVSCSFDLRQKQTGFWDVVVTNSDLQSAFKIKGFKVIDDTPEVIYAYPNPCKLSQEKKIYFVNLPDQADLFIYNLSGELIYADRDISINPYNWLLVNNSGTKIASGIYVYVIREGDTLKKGKIAIIK